jgi:hypothetical protein
MRGKTWNRADGENRIERTGGLVMLAVLGPVICFTEAQAI